MKVVRTMAKTRAAVREARERDLKVGLVPTMGAFHEGHVSLMRRARTDCDLVIVSLFVNPTQFNDPADLDAYPRDERRDAAVAAEVGVDLLFAPAADEIYTDDFATYVSVGPVGETLEGAHRGPQHFDGVSTVVLKLLNIVGPDAVYFGQKDAQQTVVVKQLVRDLNIPVSVEVCPTVRAPDGLALSSRNARLSPGERERATSLYRSLSAAEKVIASGERDPAVAARAARRVLRSSGIEPDYFDLVDPETFAPARALTGDEVVAVVAASLESARLIDNLIIEVPGARQRRTPVPDAEAEGSHTAIVPENEQASDLLAHPAA
ncbi:MAG: pantoate--beta-alanine ligase [Solirubrobacteraceae bacterium]